MNASIAIAIRTSLVTTLAVCGEEKQASCKQQFARNVAVGSLVGLPGDPNGMNGQVSYTYDPVGNRTQKVSTVPGYPGGLINYNANDQLTTDAYDSNGNTTQSNGKGYVYDFENHLVQAGGITYTYDGDGHRVSKTVNGTTITYATSDINPTGYSQVLSESYSLTFTPFSAHEHI